MILFTTNPFSLLEMLAVGYLVAIVAQMVIGFLYTRMGRPMLLVDDQWTPLYFVLTGLSWVIAAGIACYETLPLSETVVKGDCMQAGYMLAFLIVLVLFRNRRDRPQQQSFTVFLFYTCCVGLGTYIGCHQYLKSIFAA